MIVERETPNQPEVAALLAAADERSASLHLSESKYGLGLAALLSAAVRFFVARQDGRAIGCCGYLLLSERAAEVKRLFVDPAVRGRGVARLLVQAVEHAAAREGVQALFLETGVKSFEALQLYKRRGFIECERFGTYQSDPLSVFMMKRLSQPSHWLPGAAQGRTRRFGRGQCA